MSAPHQLFVVVTEDGFVMMAVESLADAKEARAADGDPSDKIYTYTLKEVVA